MNKLSMSLLLFSLSAFAQEPVTESIVIGQFTYLGTNIQGISTYQAAFDTTNVTLEPLKIAKETMYVGASSLERGPFQTPTIWQELGGDPNQSDLSPCGNCVVIAMQVQLSVSGEPVTFALANGEEFKTKGVVTVVIQALRGKEALVKHQSVSIVLQRMK